MSYRRLFLACFLVVSVFALCGAESVRLALIADVHAHDTNSPNERKVMINWEERVNAFITAAEGWSADAAISLGDFVNGRFVMGADLGEPERILGILDQTIEVFSAFDGPVHYVIGNHEVYDLSKSQILDATGEASTYYSFDLNGFHFVILDAQFDKNENDYGHIAWMVQGLVPTVELEWLKQDLAATELPTVVFIHQPLDSDFELLAGGPPVYNHLEVRTVLEGDGDVIAVFAGHDHDSHHSVINDVHYFTIASMVDHDDPTPLTWAFVTIDTESNTILVDGEGLQSDLEVSF